MNKTGRPTSYKKEYNKQVIELCRLGATDKQIAKFFAVTEQTINNWKNNEPEFFESLKKGKTESDIAVTESLYKKATGYTYTIQKEVKCKRFDDENRAIEVVEVVELEQNAPPDITAIIFWLKNRRSGAWRDKQEVEKTSEIKHTVSASPELKELIEGLISDKS